MERLDALPYTLLSDPPPSSDRKQARAAAPRASKRPSLQAVLPAIPLGRRFVQWLGLGDATARSRDAKTIDAPSLFTAARQQGGVRIKQEDLHKLVQSIVSNIHTHSPEDCVALVQSVGKGLGGAHSPDAMGPTMSSQHWAYLFEHLVEAVAKGLAPAEPRQAQPREDLQAKVRALMQGLAQAMKGDGGISNAHLRHMFDAIEAARGRLPPAAIEAMKEGLSDAVVAVDISLARHRDHWESAHISRLLSRVAQALALDKPHDKPDREAVGFLHSMIENLVAQVIAPVAALSKPSPAPPGKLFDSVSVEIEMILVTSARQIAQGIWNASLDIEPFHTAMNYFLRRLHSYDARLAIYTAEVRKTKQLETDLDRIERTQAIVQALRLESKSASLRA